MVSDSVKTNLPRQLLAASLVFVVFVLAVIALFGWLIFRSLSQREVERVLLETRTAAQGLAKQIARQADRQGKDLFTAVAVEQETQTYIDSILRQRDFVRTIEIRDRNGVLVFQNQSRGSFPVGPRSSVGARSPELPPHAAELPSPRPHIERKSYESYSATSIPNIEVPIGDLGSLQIGISAGELSKRVEVLRGELIRQA